MDRSQAEGCRAMTSSAIFLRVHQRWPKSKGAWTFRESPTLISVSDVAIVLPEGSGSTIVLRKEFAVLGFTDRAAVNESPGDIFEQMREQR